MQHADDFRKFIQTQASTTSRSLPPDGYTGSPHKHHGIGAPAMWQFLRDWTGAHKQLTFDEFVATLDGLYNGESLEEKIFAGMLLAKLSKLRQQLPLEQLDKWLGQLEGWAEVDTTCQSTFTAKELSARWEQWEPFLRQLSRDSNVNKRRASLVLLNKSLRESDDPRFIKLALELVDALKSEKDKRITKAISWVLREGIKYHRADIERFIAANRDQLPKIALREATTKLTTGKKMLASTKDSVDWNKDWLYSLIFKEVETFWNKFAARSVEQIHIAEYSDAELQKSYCKGTAIRHWVYSGDDVTSVTFDPAKPETMPDIMRQYKKVGALSFHITPDRQHVVWNYMVGYFNEGGYTYQVIGEGEQARLEFAENLGTWRG